MTLSKRHADEIEQTAVFLCFPPKRGVEGTHVDDQLAYAIALRKPVIVWIPDGPRPIPERLAGYPHTIARTDAELVTAMEAAVGAVTTVELYDGGYGP